MSGRFGVYNPLREWKKGDLPCNAMVNIAVQEYSTMKDREILVSANLMTDEEIDYAVDGLIQDLEKARKEAKRTLNKQNQKIQSTLTT